MKSKIYFLLLGTLLLVTSCELDNFNEPDAFLTGSIVYNGEAIPVARNQVRFELWQSGYDAPAPIDVAIAQDGSFSSRLFSGDYKLSFLATEGPFKAPTDTIYFSLNGNTAKDFEVNPYVMIRNSQFSHASGVVSGSCSIEQIITGADAKDVERVTLAQVDADISDFNNISMSVEIPTDATKPDQNYIFARIGVKLQGVEDMIYTHVEKVTL